MTLSSTYSLTGSFYPHNFVGVRIVFDDFAPSGDELHIGLRMKGIVVMGRRTIASNILGRTDGRTDGRISRAAQRAEGEKLFLVKRVVVLVVLRRS